MKRIISFGIGQLFALICTHAFAQFTLTDNFKTSNINNNVVLGGNPNPAMLTSGISDPVNDGWLRVTNSTINQKGFAYVKSAFSSTLGVLIDFEYKSWRSVSDPTYNGADGFSVFLFDADSVFSAGGYGGSLGYAPNTAATPSVPRGLAGGYLGVGIDEYGNYSNPTEGRNGGPGQRPNSIVLRGPTTNNAATTNAYLTGFQINPDPTVDAIDYNTTTATRPTDAQFYRRVQVEVTPSAGVYTVTVKWKTSRSGAFTQLMSYTMTTPPPANLRVGFAATTGSGVNYHEVRNVILTTTGNVRVDKNVNKSNVPVLGQVTYTMNAYNSGAVPLNGVILADTLKDGNNAALTLSPTTFSISSITFNNNGNAANTATGYTSGTPKTSGFTNPFNATLNLAANSYVTFTVVGTVQTFPAGGLITNNVGIDPTPSGIADQDLTNNFFTVSTNVYSPLNDLAIQKTLDNTCADPVNGNTYSIIVSNNGANPILASPDAVVVTDNIPAGFVVNSAAGTGWTVTNTGNTYTFKRGDALASGSTYPSILVTVHPPATGTSWVNTASVTYTGGESNTANNSSSITMYSQLAAPAAPSPVTYCPGAAASPLTATGANLLWYNIPIGGAGSPTAPTPGTSTPGNTTYYVSQSNGTCESTLSSVVVTVNPTASLTLSSAPATTSQVATVNVLITPITYTVGGSGTGAMVTGLPPGLTGAYNSGTFTISGKPTAAGPSSYTVTTTGGCSSASLGGTFSVASALPVKWLDFTAQAEQKKIRLDWTTAIEVNNTGFEVQRSADGVSWNSIGFVQSKAPNGNISTPLSYTFYDDTPSGDINYYRLKQIDMDGNADYSVIISAATGDNDNITISPNPVTATATIRGLRAGQLLRLIDLSGRVLRETVVSGSQLDLSLGQWSNGAYILQVIQDGRLIASKRLLKL